MEGRVEVCSSYYSWGTVCNKHWTPSHTRVVCQSLGYSDSEGIDNYSVKMYIHCILYSIQMYKIHKLEEPRTQYCRCL